MNPFEFKRSRAILVFSWQLLTLLFHIYRANGYICNHIHTYTQRRPQECTRYTDAICWCIKCISNGGIFHPWHDCPNWRTTLDKDLNKIKYLSPWFTKSLHCWKIQLMLKPCNKYFVFVEKTRVGFAGYHPNFHSPSDLNENVQWGTQRPQPRPGRGSDLGAWGPELSPAQQALHIQNISQGLWTFFWALITSQMLLKGHLNNSKCFTVMQMKLWRDIEARWPLRAWAVDLLPLLLGDSVARWSVD